MFQIIELFLFYQLKKKIYYEETFEYVLRQNEDFR